MATSKNSSTIYISGYNHSNDLHRLQIFLATFGRIRVMHEVVLRDDNFRPILMSSYVDGCSAAAAKECLEKAQFQGSSLRVTYCLADWFRFPQQSPPSSSSFSPSLFFSSRTPLTLLSNQQTLSFNNNSNNNNTTTSEQQPQHSSIFAMQNLTPEQIAEFTERYFGASSVSPTEQLQNAVLQPSLGLQLPKGFGRDGPIPNGNELCLWRIAQRIDTRTTFMIRNIPNKYTQKMLIDCINETHRGQYDFLYLRMDFRNHCNVGYAFINFIDAQSVISFAHHHVGRKWGRFNSDKICRLSYANIQGKKALIEKFRNSSVMEKDPSYRPKIFYSSGPLRGLEEPFPAPGSRAVTRLNNVSNESINELPSPHRIGFPSQRHGRDHDGFTIYSSTEPLSSSQRIIFPSFIDLH